MAVIYMAVNVADGSIYIGKTIKTLEQRIAKHYADSKRTKMHFHKALRKYGLDCFEWDILEEVPKSDIDNAERFWIAYFRSIGARLYNISVGGEGLTHSVGYTHSNERKSKISKATQGRKNTWVEAAHAKTYYFKSPIGEIIEVYNLTKWCKTNGFDRGYITRLVNGSKKTAYGYTLP